MPKLGKQVSRDKLENLAFSLLQFIQRIERFCGAADDGLVDFRILHVNSGVLKDLVRVF